MAFAYALDVEQDEGMRKESLMVINNFFIRFCHDNNIASAADVAAAVAQGDDKRKEIGRVLDLFENCLFFDRLGDVLDHRYFLLGQPVALMELMRNVALVFPEYLRRKCMEHNLWSHLMRLLITRADVDRLLDDERPTVNCVKSFERLRRRHFREVHGHAIGLAQDFFLMVVRTLARDDDATRKYIVLHTSFPRRIVQALSDSINWWFQAPCYRSLQRQLLLHLCATFADMLADTYVHARSVLAQGLSIEFLSSLLRVSNELLQEDKRTLVELQPVVFLLGKLFALTSYIDAVGVTLQQLLSAEDIHGASLVDGIFALYECWCDGRKFTKSELAFGIGAMTLLTDMLLLSPAVVIGATAFARLARFLLEELEHRVGW